MTLGELVETCNRAGIRLGIEAGGLRVEAPPGMLTPSIRDALTHHKPALMAALGSFTPEPEWETIEGADALPDGEAELLLDDADDDLAELEASPSSITIDPIFMHLRAWLYVVLSKSKGETIIDADGRRWDVMGTAAELLLAPFSMEWIKRIEPFYNAVMIAKPDWPTAKEAHNYSSYGP